MEEEDYIDQLKISVVQLEKYIKKVEAKCELEPLYITKLTPHYDKLSMIKCAVDALLTKIPQPREKRGRDRDSGFPSDVFNTYGSRAISGIDGGNGLSSLAIEEKSVPTDNLRPVQETESPQNMPPGKEAAENPSSDDENIKSCCGSFSKEESVL